PTAKSGSLKHLAREKLKGLSWPHGHGNAVSSNRKCLATVWNRGDRVGSARELSPGATRFSRWLRILQDMLHCFPTLGGCPQGLRNVPRALHTSLRELAGIAEHPFSRRFPLGGADNERLRGLSG